MRADHRPALPAICFTQRAFCSIFDLTIPPTVRERAGLVRFDAQHDIQITDFLVKARLQNDLTHELFFPQPETKAIIKDFSVEQGTLKT